MKGEHQFIPYESQDYPIEKVIQESKAYYEYMDKRRTVRDFSDKPVPFEVIEHIVMTASSAPSGAHKQPWTFCVISDPVIKKQIRIAAEEEEYKSYHGRMSEEWLKDLEPIGTDWHKPFLETAPYLIIVFKKAYDLDSDGNRLKNYYVNESVGIACGFLLTAIHQAGLISLTHTPSPMNFLQKILKRPANERPYLLVPVGYPTDDAKVPALLRKPASEVLIHYKPKE